MSGRKTLTLFSLFGALGGALGACGHAQRGSPSNAASSGEQITLYRDGARFHQSVTVHATGRTAQRISIVVPFGVDAAEAKLVDTTGLDVSPIENEDSTDVTSKLTFEVTAKKPGTYYPALEYVVPALSWSAAYTLTTTPAHTSVTMRGALGLTNKLGAPLAHVHVKLVDDNLGAAEKVTPLDLGEADIPAGESRLELLANDLPRAMHSVLVYDAIGSGLDEKSGTPNSDPDVGARTPSTAHVIESYEIARPSSQPQGLPSGPARLFERGSDGQLRLLGESELFGSQTHDATVDTIAIGDASGVTGERERRDLTNDPDTRRLSEEFAITLSNTRGTPVEVVVREHLYRSATYAIGYVNVATQKEGTQQFAMRVKVPARGKMRIFYVVVYTGSQ